MHAISVGNLDSHSDLANPIDAETEREQTTRFDGQGRAILQTLWLSPRGTVDVSEPPIAGLDGIALTEGITTQYLYDDDLTDGVGLDLSLIHI